jgi:endonuclease G, mitochondrial
MPNDQSVDFDWAKYRVSVCEVEKLTGYTFFPKIDAEVAAEIKRDSDAVKMKTPKMKAN